MKIQKIVLFYILSGFLLCYTINSFAVAFNLYQCLKYQQLSFIQKAKVNEIIREFNKMVTPLKGQLQTYENALETQLNQAKIDQQIVNNMVNRISSLRNQIYAERIEMRVQLIKTADFNMAQCTNPIFQESCSSGVCKQPVYTVRGPQAGLRSSPKQGVESSPNVNNSTEPKDNSEKYWW